MAFLVRGVDQWSAARPEVARLRSNTIDTTWHRGKRSKVRVYALHSSDANLLGSARQVLCLFWIVGANWMFLVHSQCVLRRCRMCQSQLVGTLTHRLAKVSQSASQNYSVSVVCEWFILCAFMCIVYLELHGKELKAAASSARSLISLLLRRRGEPGLSQRKKLNRRPRQLTSFLYKSIDNKSNYVSVWCETEQQTFPKRGMFMYLQTFLLQ